MSRPLATDHHLELLNKSLDPPAISRKIPWIFQEWVWALKLLMSQYNLYMSVNVQMQRVKYVDKNFKQFLHMHSTVDQLRGDPLSSAW